MSHQGAISTSFPSTVIRSTVRLLMQFKVFSRVLLAGLQGYCNYMERYFKVSESTGVETAVVGKEWVFSYTAEVQN